MTSMPTDTRALLEIMKLSAQVSELQAIIGRSRLDDDDQFTIEIYATAHFEMIPSDDDDVGYDGYSEERVSDRMTFTRSRFPGLAQAIDDGDCESDDIGAAMGYAMYLLQKKVYTPSGSILRFWDDFGFWVVE